LVASTRESFFVVYAQRKRNVNSDKIKQMFDDGLTKAAIAKQLNISLMSMYRSLQG
jgi:DNA invertase Pin-like site-specific DNA recombinase